MSRETGVQTGSGVRRHRSAHRGVEPAHCAHPLRAGSGHDERWLIVSPRDTVLVRDGRGFDAGADTAAEPVQPWPSTIAGALAAACGREPCAVRGPVLVREGAAGPRAYFAVPADLVRTAGSNADVVRLRSGAARVVTDLDAGFRTGPGVPPTGSGEVRWLLASGRAGKDEPVDGLLSGAALGRYLADGLVGASRRVRLADLRSGRDLEPDPQIREARVGLAREDRTARTGFLYQAAHLRLKDGWGFAAEVVIPQGWAREPAGPVPFGGRARLADAESARDVAWPDRPAVFPDGRVLVYVATPAVWPDGWRLPVPAGARLVAAAVGEPRAVATASPRDGVMRTRALRWAVPAGSVYLLRFDAAERAGAWAARVHATALGPAIDGRLQTAGFGVILTGVWSP